MIHLSIKDLLRRRHVNRRIAAVAIHDVVMAVIAFNFSIWIRHYMTGDMQPLGHTWFSTLIFSLIAVAVFNYMRLYRGIWYYASITDLIAITKAVSLVILIFLPILFTLTRLEHFPRTAVFILWPSLILLLAAPRLIYRWLKDGNFKLVFDREAAKRIPVLVVGSGDVADAFVRQMRRIREAPYRVVGIIDQKRGRIGRDLHGIEIMGPLEELPRVVEDLSRRGNRPQRAIIASNRLEGEQIDGLLEKAQALALPLSRLPRMTDFSRATKALSQEIRPIDVEDLLGRPQQILDRAAMAALIEGRRVLVTGAGGTIGSELCRQVAAHQPGKLVLLDVSEFALYEIDIELAGKYPQLPRRPLLGDVRDAAQLEKIFLDEAPEIIFHAAAYKHVPMIEHNACQGVRTNVGGTLNVARLAAKHRIATMVLISTDKAVNPASVMGATKRVAEMILQGLSVQQRHTRYVTVRFGNVLGSTGSVVPLFQKQLRSGGPLTVTHPEITRYFMTTREAVELVLQAAALAPEADEAGKINVLDMGSPVRIDELARKMIRLAGLRPEIDIEIAYTGLRPGEKLHEALFHDAETHAPTNAPGIFRAAPRIVDFAILEPGLQTLLAHARDDNEAQIRAQLAILVPEFQSPAADSNSLDDAAAAVSENRVNSLQPH